MKKATGLAIGILVVVFAMLVSSCQAAATVQDPSQPAGTGQPSATSLATTPAATSASTAGSSIQTSGPTTVPTTTAKPRPAILGVIDVSAGDQLERDIIPQLCKIFSLSTTAVKGSLAAVESGSLISERTKDFRRMEGILVPGKYEVLEGTSLKTLIALWVTAAEKRYQSILTSITDRNSLTAQEQLTLASIVEAECLANRSHREVATVFQNRLADGARLQSCVTAEYALGYQRPYLTGEDLKVQSDYNTYIASRLPPGPICVVGDDSLRAAARQKLDSRIYYFYYDYLKDELFFFTDYKAFSAAASLSRKQFIDTADTDLRAKINKQEWVPHVRP